jgi:hypothetical protein
MTDQPPAARDCLPSRLLGLALSVVGQGEHDQLLTDELLRAHRVRDQEALIRHVSQIIAKKLQVVAANLLKPTEAAQVEAALAATPIVWLPRSAFYLAAVQDGSDRLVVISNGTLDTINMISQYMLLEIVMSRLTEAGVEEYLQEAAEFADLKWLFCSMFRSSLTGKAFFAPDVVHEMAPALQLPALTLIHTIRLFALLHEIGHLRLGHVDRGFTWKFWVRTRVRVEGAPIRESSNRQKMMEHEADEFALRIAGGDTLLEPATLFFQLLSLVDLLRGHRSDDHPHAANRIAYLRTQLSLPPQDNKSTIENLLGLVQQAGGQFNPPLDLSIERSQYPTAPDRLLEKVAFRRKAVRLYDFVSNYPEILKDLWAGPAG